MRTLTGNLTTKLTSNQIKQPPQTIFGQIHCTLLDLPILFRDLSCRECQWSTPTYYRKLRAGKISNAEKEKLVQINDLVLRFARNETSEEERNNLAGMMEEIRFNRQQSQKD